MIIICALPVVPLMTTETGAWLACPSIRPTWAWARAHPKKNERKKRNKKNFEQKAKVKSKSKIKIKLPRQGSPPLPLPLFSPLPLLLLVDCPPQRPSAITYKYKIVPAYAQLHSALFVLLLLLLLGTQNDIWALISHPLARLDCFACA